MNYQTAWNEKTQHLPEEIFSRIDPTLLATISRGRTFLSGPGAELLLSKTANNKIFLVNPLTPPQNNPAVTVLTGNILKKLSAFPPGTFSLVIKLWALPGNPLESFKIAYQSLKKGGVFSVITLQDNAPKIPMNILKRILRNHRDWSLRMFKSELPLSNNHLRQTLTKVGFSDIRVWKDKITCCYQTAEDVYDDLSSQDNSLFRDEIPVNIQNIIRREFIKEAAKYPLEINYDFLGAVGVKQDSYLSK